MSAERLRDAAKVLRGGADGAIESLHGSRSWHGIGTGYRTQIEAHIQNMSPVFALAVADWLDEEAERVEWGAQSITFDGAPMFPPNRRALTLANTILGTAS